MGAMARTDLARTDLFTRRAPPSPGRPLPAKVEGGSYACTERGAHTRRASGCLPPPSLGQTVGLQDLGHVALRELLPDEVRDVHGLLRLVRVLGAGVDLQVVDLPAPQALLRDHAPHRLLHDALRDARLQLLEGLRLLAPH